MGRLPRLVMWAVAVIGAVGPAWLVPDEILACLWLLLWGVFFTACWVRSTARALVVRGYRQPPVLLRLDDPFRRKTRLAFFLSVLLVLTRLPFLLSVLVSRPWLDPYAYHLWAEIPATEILPNRPVLKGIVIVQRIEVGGGSVTFGFYGGGGVIYVPTDDRERLRLEWWSWYPYFW